MFKESLSKLKEIKYTFDIIMGLIAGLKRALYNHVKYIL